MAASAFEVKRMNVNQKKRINLARKFRYDKGNNDYNNRNL